MATVDGVELRAQLTPEVVQRVCKHMNDDHADGNRACASRLCACISLDRVLSVAVENAELTHRYVNAFTEHKSAVAARMTGLDDRGYEHRTSHPCITRACLGAS